MMRERKEQGFTLTEALVTLVVLAVLAGLAIPNYRATVELSRQNEAVINLITIHGGEGAYALNHNNVRWPPGQLPDADANPNTAIATINDKLNVELNARFYNLSVSTPGVGATTYCADATRNGVQGGDGRQFCINQNGGDPRPGACGGAC